MRIPTHDDNIQHLGAESSFMKRSERKMEKSSVTKVYVERRAFLTLGKGLFVPLHQKR